MYSPANDSGCLLSLNVGNNTNGVGDSKSQPDKNRLSDLSGYAADTSRAGSACSSTYVPAAPSIVNRLSQVSNSSGSSGASVINPYAHALQPALLSDSYRRYITTRWKNVDLLLSILDELDKHKTQCPGFLASRVELDVINENHTYFKPNGGVKPNSAKRTKRPQTQREHGSKRVREDEDEIPLGVIVFAKHQDSRYFAAKVLKKTGNKRWLLEFYDGIIKNVFYKFIICDYMELIMGRRVLYVGDDQVSYPAIIADCKVIDGIPMMMALTNEGDFDVPIGKIYFTESHLKAVKAEFDSPIPQKRVARSPRITKPLVKAAGKYDNPVACTSGIAKVRPCTSTKQPLKTSFSGNDDIPEPQVTTITHITGCEDEVLLQPPAPESAIRLKNISGKLPRFANPIDNSIVGPINAGQWFKGMFFLLTSNSRRVNVIPNMDASTDSEDFQFTNIPFVYDRLELQIRLGQGTILYSTADIPPNNLNNTYLIAPRPCLTRKYIECLSLDMTVLCHEWVVNCCKMQRRIPFQDLPLGWSLEHQRFIKSDEIPYTNVFRSTRIQIAHNSNAPFYDFWSKIIRCLGGSVTKFIGEWINADFILVEDGYRNEGLNIAEQTVPLVSTTWVVQSLLLRKVREAKGHILYNPHFEECESL